MTFKLTEKQRLAWSVLGSEATHCFLYGGSRSGKTFLILRALAIRSLGHRSRHAILRFRFNHAKASIIADTFPKMMELCFPDVAPHVKLDKSDWFYSFPNGSQIWVGGLDDKDRTEKILGQEYASIFLNECSQIPWASRNIAMTRLAQRTPLRLKAFYDENPPTEGHWTYKMFIMNRDPENGSKVNNPHNYAHYQINPKDNIDNLPPEYIQELDGLPKRLRDRFLLGLFGSATEHPLWTEELLDQSRFDGPELPAMQRIIISVDPSGASGSEDERSDEIGITVVGLGTDGEGYVLDDLSGLYGPAQWGKIVADAFERYEADRVVAETNFGGAMVGEVIRAARPGTPYSEVKASRGKVARAEPVAFLFEKTKVHMAGFFPDLERQLCSFTSAGYTGPRSPDRADAMIWGLSFLFPGLSRKEEKKHRTPNIILQHQELKQRGRPNIVRRNFG